jgi:hypothetical protein
MSKHKGRNLDHALLRRQHHPATAAASQAKPVMCKPEIDIKCATPVMRNTSQSARSMAA